VDCGATYVRGRRRFGDSGGASFAEFREAVFEFSTLFYLMRINIHHAADLDSDRQSSTDEDWVVSHGKGSRANIILWGMPRDVSTLEVRAKLANFGLASFVRGKVVGEGDHLRLVLTASDSKGVTKEQVSQISSILRKIGCRCVLDEPKRVVHKTGQLVCRNRFEPLSVVEPGEPVRSGIECGSDNENVDFNRVRENVSAGNRQKRKLRVGTWNFSGLCSERKQNEVGELLQVNNIDVVAGQESWEKEDSRINVDGYKWFGNLSLVMFKIVREGREVLDSLFAIAWLMR